MSLHVLQCRCRDCKRLFEAPSPSSLRPAEFTAALTRLACPACGTPLAGGDLDQHRSLIEDRILRKSSPESPSAERAADWLATGEWGLPASVLFATMTASTPRSMPAAAYPRRPLDLHRCLLLLDRMPEWRERLDRMNEVSIGWKIVVTSWKALEDVYRREVGEGLEGLHAPRTEDLFALLEFDETCAA